MNWNGIKVFITGAEGFIGSYLAGLLTEGGAHVTAMAQYNSWSSFGWLDDSPIRHDMKCVHGDVRDPEQLRDLLKGEQVIFHLAALMSVPHSSQAPRSYLETNVNGTMNVLHAGRDAERIINTSTSEVYGTAQEVPIHEDHRIFPQSPYAASKVGGDAVARSFFESFNTPVITLRPFNTYGPRQSERAVIPAIIRQLLDPQCTRINLGDLTPRRDLTYVDDTVMAFASMMSGKLGEVYNCGAGESISIGALANKLVGERKNIISTSDRKRTNDVMDLVAGTKKIKEATQWEPKTSLTEGLELTLKWWKKYIGDLKGEVRYRI
tara:strand:- start:1566 stop:2531 length:966 start_codon:yes stop_codon:yes gene_type:complete